MRWCYLPSFLAVVACSPPATAPAEQAAATDAPPPALMQENCQQADAIIAGTVLTVRDAGTGHFASALLQVDATYKGPLQPADTIRYYTFREEKYSSATAKQRQLVFLKQHREHNVVSWFTATDLAIFTPNPATIALLHNTLH